MPTELPPDYKPQPVNDPANPADPTVPGAEPAFPPEQGNDSTDPLGVPTPGGDVVDPGPGWRVPPFAPGADPGGVPAPAGIPTF